MKRKTVTIDENVHKVFKNYCDKRGLKLAKFLETLIEDFLIVERLKEGKTDASKRI